MNRISEKRKHARIKKQFIASFRTKPYEDMVSTGWKMTVLVNLSASGARFFSKESLDIGTILDFNIGVSL